MTTPNAPSGDTAELSWLDGGGEAGALIRAFDWTTTGLGPVDRWPQSLRTVTGMLLLSPVPIVLLWGEKGIMIYNDAYSVFAGSRHPALLGSEVRKGWAEVADFNDNVMRVGLAGGTLAYKDQQLTLVRHGKPEPVWMDLDYSPVLDETGKPGGVIAIVVETTERVLAEAEVRESERRFREELEAKVAERTEALRRSEENIRKAEMALMQVQKMEALGNLTGGIAHDFNNLLMAVQGSLELLRERMPQEPLLLRLLDNAMAGAQRGSTLTRRMLAYARRQELKTERVDMRNLVEGMKELMQRSLGGTIVVETRFALGLPPVEADANQLEAALLNLAVNARDAMDGAGTIVISTSERWIQDAEGVVPPGHYVRLSLSDSGAGMDEDTLNRAIEPFFTTKGVGKGTGLGLSMVHGLAEQLGGALVLRSRKDEGTTAEIWLPAAPHAEETMPPAVRSAQAFSRVSSSRALRILAVDDDELVRATTVEMLEDLGYAVIAARSAAEALSMIDDAVDLVITDHAMPQMTGAQLAVELRQRYPDLPVVLATGYAEMPAGQSPELPRLAKPYSQASLARMVVQVMPGG
ncbi:ATP-binding protein [Luteibacter yeojuensis]|uniref:histidine kinase n=1 Tax=Luteibacter yeojuensis TaxID=345309 RepID=A0A7X5QVW0_9GAMM|nr:ATP-binding protein [Luteibacter yeojuensis]NID16388.1 response regulator [Luteibacter yeojuensis]